LRLAEANFMTLADFSRLGIRYEPDCLLRQRLLPEAEVEPQVFAHMSHMAALLRDKSRIWNLRLGRFCPHCLKESPSWKASWELYFHDACPQHGNWLLDRCGKCGLPLSWGRDALLHCQCGLDIRTATTREAPESVCRLSALLEAKLLGQAENEPQSPFGALDVDQVQRLIRYLGAYMGNGFGAKPMKLRCADQLDVSWPVTSLAAEVIFDWPRVFHVALSQLQTLSTGEKVGLMGMFRHAYAYLYKGFREANFAPVRDAFESWLAEHWTGGLARRNRRLNDELLKAVRWIPGNVAAAELGISSACLKFLVREGMLDGRESVSSTGRSFMVVRRDQFEEIRTRLEDEMPLNEVAIRLGMSRERTRQLMRLIFPFARRVNDKIYMPWCVPRGEVEALLKLGGDLPTCSQSSSQNVSLGHLFKYWCWSSSEVVGLIQAVRAGTILPIALVEGAVGISRWVFDAEELKAFQKRCGTSQADSLSVPEMGQMLGIKQEVAYWLVRHCFIPNEKAGRFSSARVRREDIEGFQAQHVFGRELATLLGRSAKKTAGLLGERAIYPLQIEGAEGCRQLIYRLDKPMREFLAETGKLPSSNGFGSLVECSEDFCLRSSFGG
jgi:hypothetical protein